MATITPTFKQQGTGGSTGNVMTCCRYGNANPSTTCDIGGTGSGSNYRNVVYARFADLPADASEIISASVKITYQQSGSDYWAAAQTLSVQGCANFTNATTGTNRPATYGAAKTGSLAGSTASISIECLAQIKASINNGAKCLFISANAANNRKRVSSIVLTYTIDPWKHVVFNGEQVKHIILNGTEPTHLIFNGNTVY